MSDILVVMNLPQGCRIWYKSEDQGTIDTWPCSSLHAIQALDLIRWEHFDPQCVDSIEFG